MDLNSATIFFSVHFLQHSYFKEFSCHETFKEIINYLEKVNRNLPKMRLSCQKQQRLMSWRGQVDRAEQLSSANTSPGLYLTLPWCTLQCFLFCFRPRERGNRGRYGYRGRWLATFWRIDLLLTESMSWSSVMLQGGGGQTVTIRRLISG